MTKDINHFIDNCHTCRRAKAPRDKKFGELEPWPIPEQRWKDVAMDFVTGLPESQGMNAILTVTDRLPKARHFIACRAGELGTSSEVTAKMLLHHVWNLHGLPDSIVSDRGTQFVSDVWTRLCKILNIKRKLSTAYHPETDGQSENTNQWMKQWLRMFVNHKQDDWTELLPMAEFAANATPSDATGMSPFFLNNGHEPRMSFSYEPQAAKNARQRQEFKEAESITERLKEALIRAKVNLVAAQKVMTVAANRKRQFVSFEVGDDVWLNSKNLRTDRPSKKLDDKMIGPFRITAKHGSSCVLNLPNIMAVHRTFHVNLLRKDPNNPLPGQENEAPPPIVVDDEEEWEVEEILESRKHRNQL